MSNDTARGLDHVGVAGTDLAAMAAQYERLGFTLTPLARHSGQRTPDGPVVPFGTGNRCVMLRQGYLELIAIVEPEASSATLDRFLARYHGIHIMALDVDDAAANLPRLRAAGFDIPGILPLERPVDSAHPTGPQARFARVPLPDATEGRLQLIQHLTREAIWQERFMVHPNNAVALAELVLALAEPAQTAAWFSRMAGHPAVPDAVGGYALDLPHGRVRMLPAAALEQVFPGVTPPCLPFIAGITVRTGDGNAAIGRLVAERRIAATATEAGLVVLPADAAGAAIRFIAAT